jgi:Ca-activated chloride channel family protein
MIRRMLSIALCLTVLSGCIGTGARETVLRVLASSELADMQPLLDELEDETGVRLEMDYRARSTRRTH